MYVCMYVCMYVQVAYEVLRRLAETKGNFKEASEMADFESKKPKIARQIMGTVTYLPSCVCMYVLYVCTVCACRGEEKRRL
jgi:hypothetical protein